MKPKRGNHKSFVLQKVQPALLRLMDSAVSTLAPIFAVAGLTGKPTEARAIALKAHPGKITDEELEKEKGGTGLRYSFDIKRGTVTQEVGVDAQTGKVLENKKEGPHPD